MFSKVFWCHAANRHHLALSWAASSRQKSFFKAVRSTLNKLRV